MAIIVIYMYSLVSFFYLRTQYGSLDCYSAFSCWMTNIDYGLRSGGGIGDILDPANVTGQYSARFIYDLSFFIIIIVIFINLIFGIIIDTFGGKKQCIAKAYIYART